MKITCVVPAHNEEDNLNGLIGELAPIIEIVREAKNYKNSVTNKRQIHIDTKKLMKCRC